MIIIEEQTKNNICWIIIFLWFKTSSNEIITPNKLTKNPVKIEIIIISNTSDKNRENLNNINKLEKGGLSGKPLYQVSNNIISKFYKLIGNKIKIIGVGGVDSGEAAFEKIIRGASLVQLYTGMVYKGPSIASSISSELINILKNKGFKNISEAVGSKYWTWRIKFQILYSLIIYV